MYYLSSRSIIDPRHTKEVGIPQCPKHVIRYFSVERCFSLSLSFSHCTLYYYTIKVLSLLMFLIPMNTNWPKMFMHVQIFVRFTLMNIAELCKKGLFLAIAIYLKWSGLFCTVLFFRAYFAKKKKIAIWKKNVSPKITFFSDFLNELCIRHTLWTAVIKFHSFSCLFAVLFYSFFVPISAILFGIWCKHASGTLLCDTCAKTGINTYIYTCLFTPYSVYSPILIPEWNEERQSYRMNCECVWVSGVLKWKHTKLVQYSLCIPTPIKKHFARNFVKSFYHSRPSMKRKLSPDMLHCSVYWCMYNTVCYI